MKKALLLTALLALTTLAAQAKDVEELEATVSQIINDAMKTSQQDTKTLQKDKNDTKGKETQNRVPSQNTK